MPQRFTCVKGHHWEDADGHARPPACPVCGALPRAPGGGAPATDAVTGMPQDSSSAVDLLRRPSTEVIIPVPPPRSFPMLPEVPGYDVFGELGRGGMGVVYKARQKGLNRTVALKMILAGAHANAEDLARFRAEAEAVARLQHPHIVQIYEIGAHDGLPFFSLEFVDGGSLAQRLDGKPLAPAQSAALVEALARAMHHAHQQGIIHRDLKPGNVLLAVDSGKWTLGRKGQDGAGTLPTAGGLLPAIPKITDFGLAKRLEGGSGLTRSGTIVGTPSYMAPEQAAGKISLIGPAADVYALGAILYEMLTGWPPFCGETPFDTVLLVLSQEPVPPIRLQPKVPVDLNTICLKCLEKEPGRRYASAEALADDLHRFLHQEPIRARPINPWERAVKWARRRPAVAGLLLLTILVGLIGFAGVLWQWRNAEAARERAEGLARAEAAQRQQTEAALAEVQSRYYFNRIALADREWFANHVGRAETLLDECPPGLRRWEWYYLKRLCHANLLTIEAPKSLPQCVAYNPDGTLIAAGGADGHVYFWDAATGQPVRAFHLHLLMVRSLAFSPDGRRAASAGNEGTLKIWDPATGNVIRSLPTMDKKVQRLTFSPDGQVLATIAEVDARSEVKVWNVSTGENLLTYNGHSGLIQGTAFSPDSKQMVSVGTDRIIRVWNAATGVEDFTIKDPGAFHTAVAWSRGGQTLATGTFDGLVKLWDIPGRKEIRQLRGHAEKVTSLAFSGDGKRLVSGSADETIRVWAGGPYSVGLRGHKGAVQSVAFHPAGRWLLSCSLDHTIKVWDTQVGQAYRSLRGHANTVLAVAFRPDTRQLASGANDGTIRVWDASGALTQRILAHAGGVRCLAYRADGKQLVSGGKDKTIRIWDAEAGQPIRAITGHTGFIGSVEFSPDGRRIAATGEYSALDEARVWDAETGQLVFPLPGHDGSVQAVCYSHDGRFLATAADDNKVRLWDAHSGQLLRTLLGHRDNVACLAFSPDGQWLASGCNQDEDGEIKIWAVATGEAQVGFRGHAKGVTALAFSPDSQRLASASYDRTIKLWEPRTGQQVLQLAGNGEPFWGLAFSSDGEVLAAANADNAILIYEAPSR